MVEYTHMNKKIKLAKLAFVLSVLSFAGVLFGSDLETFVIFSASCLAYSYLALCLFRKYGAEDLPKAFTGSLVAMTVFLGIHVLFLAIALIFRNSEGFEFFLTLLGTIPAMIVGAIIGGTRDLFGKKESNREILVVSIFRKLEKKEIINLFIIIVVPVTISYSYLYIKYQNASQRTLSSAAFDIDASRMQGAEQSLGDQMQKESIAMNAVVETAKAEHNILIAIDKMLSIAGDEPQAVDVRLTALESLAPKIGEMNQSEKKILSDKLATFSEQVNKSTQLSEMNKERMAGRITMLQKMLEGR